MVRQRVQWTDATAGMSSDEYFGPRGSFYDSKSIDCTLNSGWSIVSDDWLGSAGAINTSSTGWTVGMVGGSSTTNLMALAYNGVLKNPLYTSETYTISTGFGLNCGFHKQCGILIGADGGTGITVYRWIFDGTNVSCGIGTAGANISSACTYTLGASHNGKAIILQQTAGFYVATNNEVWLVDTTTGTWGATLALSIGTKEEIVAMTEIGDQIIVYANNGTVGRQYFWNKIDKSFQRVINWYDRPFQNVANLNNIDYAFTGSYDANQKNKKQIYIASGYQPQLLKTSIPNQFANYYIPKKNVRFIFSPRYTNAIETMTQRIFVPDEFGNIYSVGNTIPGLPQSVHKQFSVDGIVTALYFNESVQNLLYVYYTSSKITGTSANYVSVFVLGAAGYRPQGTAYILRNKFFGPYQGLNKQSCKVKYTAKLRNSYEKVYLLANKDDNMNEISAFCGWDENNYTTKADFKGIPAIGDVYTGFGGNTWTVTYSDVANGGGAIYMGAVSFSTPTVTSSTDFTVEPATLTKVSGSGPATLGIRNLQFGKVYDYLVGTGGFNDTKAEVKTRTVVIPGDFKEIQIGQVFVASSYSSNRKQSPAIGEVTMAYDTIKDDLT